MGIKKIHTATPRLSHQKSKRLKSVVKLSLAFIICVSSLVSILLSSPAAYAAAPQGAQDNAKSWLYYQAISRCIEDSTLVEDSNIFYTNNRIPEAYAEKGSWFNNGNLPTYVAVEYFPGTDESGTQNSYCGNIEEIITGAAQLWGYTTIELLCATGAERVDESDCVDSVSGSDFVGDKDSGGAIGPRSYLSLTKFQTAIKDKVYDGSDPTISDAAKYYMYRKILLNGCLGPNVDLSETYTGDSTDKSWLYNIYNINNDGSGLDKTNTYLGATQRSNGLSFFSDEDGGKTCADLESYVNKYAKAYSASIIEKITIQQPEDTSTGVENVTENEISCSSEVKAIGWILCPILNALTSLNDFVWGLVKGLLTVNPLTQGVSGESSSNLYDAWSSIRNIANVIFGIAFLVIIFSQMTSIGITNYGVKKLLPRLIIVAILVNLSFIAMQIAVDLANIVGSSLYELIIGEKGKIDLTWGALLGLASSAAGATAVTAGAVVIAQGSGALFLLLVPSAAIGALGVIAAIFTLIFRQAVIPVLAILAPLAFVAMLLPNTESLFKTWKNLLIKMLMLYPLAAIIFGGAQFAASIIAGDKSSWWNYLIALIVLNVPLFSLPFIAAKGGAITDAVGGSLNKMIQAAKKPLNEEFKSRAALRGSNYVNTKDDDGNEIKRRRNPLRSLSINRARAKQTRETKLGTNKAKFETSWLDTEKGKTVKDAESLATTNLDNARSKAQIRFKESAVGRVAVDNLGDAKKTIEALDTEAATRQSQSLTGRFINNRLGRAKLELHGEESRTATQVETNNVGLIQESKLAEKQLDEAKSLTGRITAEATAGNTDMLISHGVDAAQATVISDGFHQAQENIDVATLATASANNVNRQAFNAELAEGGQLTTAAAGIDIENGVPRVEATAIANIGVESDKNVAAAKSLFKSRGYSSKELAAIPITGKLRDGSQASNEQISAAIESTVDIGYFPDIRDIINSVAEKAKIAEATPNAPDKDNEIQQKTLADALVKKKFVTTPGPILGELSQGTMSQNYSEFIKSTIMKEKISRAVIPNMSAEEMNDVYIFLSDKKNLAGEKDQAEVRRVLNSLGDTLIESLADPRVNASLSPVQRDTLGKIIEIL